MPSKHGDSEDPGVYGVRKPERVSKTSQLNPEYIVEGQLDMVDSSHEKVGEGIESLDPDDGEVPLFDGASQLRSSFGSVVPVNPIDLRRACVIRGRPRSTIPVKDLQGPSIRSERDNNTSSILLVNSVTALDAVILGDGTAVILGDGTAGILSDGSAILNPRYQCLPTVFNIRGFRGLQNVRSTI
ncbi:hypothetical protein [Ferrimicrobium acidiphilum]|uniref:hypothetical protein n=1 Tax=Ferrimicrobium acidiphilum TaxID=121039 RepID=UPI0023F2DB9E|nr:hypothetical protein [Ferrimicrobium acidiphilum]